MLFPHIDPSEHLKEHPCTLQSTPQSTSLSTPISQSTLRSTLQSIFRDFPLEHSCSRLADCQSKLFAKTDSPSFFCRTHPVWRRTQRVLSIWDSFVGGGTGWGGNRGSVTAGCPSAHDRQTPYRQRDATPLVFLREDQSCATFA